MQAMTQTSLQTTTLVDSERVDLGMSMRPLQMPENNFRRAQSIVLLYQMEVKVMNLGHYYALDERDQIMSITPRLQRKSMSRNSKIIYGLSLIFLRFSPLFGKR